MMPEFDRLPDLPLMLAGAPRPVRDALRTAGIPVRLLPAVMISAAGCGRFVLFDGRTVRGSQQARCARRMGLQTIDLAQFHLPSEREAPLSAAQAAVFIYDLKETLERFGGLWLRIADYPFPYEGAMCLSIEHRLEDLPELARYKDLLPGAVTHFIPNRVRGDWLTYAALVGAGELGWTIDHDALENSPRKTRTHWATRHRRFHEAGLPVRGLRLSEPDLPLPGLSALAHLGLAYSCSRAPLNETSIRSDGEWTHFRVADLDRLAAQDLEPAACIGKRLGDNPAAVNPPHFAASLAATNVPHDDVPPVLAAIQANHRAGRPIFVHATSRHVDVLPQFLLLRAAAARLSLMWSTTFGEFATWWTRRQKIDVQAWLQHGGCVVQATGDLDAAPIAMELWRGQHRAVLPLTQASQSVRDDGVAFVHSPERDPAGLARQPDRFASTQTRSRLSGPKSFVVSNDQVPMTNDQ